jgi:hypothetical protein
VDRESIAARVDALRAVETAGRSCARPRDSTSLVNEHYWLRNPLPRKEKMPLQRCVEHHCSFLCCLVPCAFGLCARCSCIRRPSSKKSLPSRPSVPAQQQAGCSDLLRRRSVQVLVPESIQKQQQA